jgi:hypothetical protein
MATPWWLFVFRLSSVVLTLILVLIPPLSDGSLQGRQHQDILRFLYVDGDPAPVSGFAVLACSHFEIFGHYRQLLLGFFLVRTILRAAFVVLRQVWRLHSHPHILLPHTPREALVGQYLEDSFVGCSRFFGN